MEQNIIESGTSGKFSDYPAVEHREDYEPARKDLLQRAAEIPELLGLYEYGSVGAPGISDIDLIAVIDSNIDQREVLEFLSGAGAPPHVVRVLDQGTIKPVSESLFRRINVLGTIGTSPIYAPNPITPEVPNQDDKILIDISNVIDWLPERVLMLRALQNSPILSCRRVLGGLGSFKHSASTVTSVLGYEPEHSTKFAKAYDELRSSWFDKSENDNFKNTVELINMGIALGISLLTEVTDHLIEKKMLEPNDSANGSKFWLNSSKAFVFDNTPTSIPDPSKASPVLFQNVPTAWIHVLTSYASATGKISSLIGENLEMAVTHTKRNIQNELSIILNQRIEWINESFEFLNPIGLSELMYRFSHLRSRAR